MKTYAPQLQNYTMSDGTMSGVHFGRKENPLKLVFLHANGFNALAYRQIIEALGIHALALDLRGHGFTRLPTNMDTLDSFHIFRDDIIEFFNRYIDSPVLLAGHSLGAVSGILAVPKIQEILSGYVGFDPVSLPWMARLPLKIKAGRNYAKSRFSLARNAGRRRSIFSSPQEAFERYKDRGAFRNVTDEILRDYLDGGLELRDDGHYHLCCDPLWEQAIYVAQNHNLYEATRALPNNSHIIYAGKFGAVSSPATRKAVQKRQPKITVDFDNDLAHLFPFQNPNLAASLLKQTLIQASLS